MGLNDSDEVPQRPPKYLKYVEPVAYGGLIVFCLVVWFVIGPDGLPSWAKFLVGGPPPWDAVRSY
jgi:hypothetical protein